MDGGMFHDAHEVWSRNELRGLPDWYWMATLATKDLAEVYIEFCRASAGHALNLGQEWELRAV